MDIAVIGGTGLISSAIVAELVAREHQVTVLNRGSMRSVPTGQVDHVKCDRTDGRQLGEVLQELGHLDALIDMAGFTNDDGEHLVEAARGVVRQIIFCSTVEVYSKPAARLPVAEDAPCVPTFGYGIGKRACESVLRRAEESGDLVVTVFRPAYTYGETRPPIYPLGDALYLERITAGAPIVVPGDGLTWWVGAHRQDVAKAFAAAAGNPVAFGKTYNVAGTNPMTWLDWHSRAASALDAPEPDFLFIPGDLLSQASPDVYAPREFVFTSDYVFDSTAAERDLEFRPAIEWEDGLRRVHRWQSEHGGSPPSELRAAHDKLVAHWADLRSAFIESVR